MAQRFPWFGFTLASAGLVGVGYIIMKATSPTEEQVYNKMAPDLRRQVDANRAARLAREEATKHQTEAQLADPDASKPVWADHSKRPS